MSMTKAIRLLCLLIYRVIGSFGSLTTILSIQCVADFVRALSSLTPTQILPNDFECIAKTQNHVGAVAHKSKPIYGIQVSAAIVANRFSLFSAVSC